MIIEVLEPLRGDILSHLQSFFAISGREAGVCQRTLVGPKIASLIGRAILARAGDTKKYHLLVGFFLDSLMVDVHDHSHPPQQLLMCLKIIRRQRNRFCHNFLRKRRCQQSWRLVHFPLLLWMLMRGVLCPLGARLGANARVFAVSVLLTATRWSRLR